MEAIKLDHFGIRDGVYIQDGEPLNNVFEKKYISVRQKENRIYTDNGVLELPEIDPNHPHYKEWIVRERTCIRLTKYLKAKHKPLEIMEIGCGNGWLCAQMSKISNTEVYGVDVNFTELAQAARVFENRANLHFIYGDIQSGLFLPSQLDIIVFAAAIQYFPSFKKIIDIALHHLNDEGEIHILDTLFYNSSEMAGARQRSEEYYASLGYPEMADHYFHHDKKELKQFHIRYLYDPNRLLNQLIRPNDIFPWICIRKSQNIIPVSAK